MAHASGALLGFTDSDCLPDPDWIAKGVACLLQTPNCGLVGGRIEMFADEPGPPTVATALSVASHLQQARFLQGGWAVCA
ncbi:MAG: glycosyltransferase family A protein, partial [Gemmatimonas sp.]